MALTCRQARRLSSAALGGHGAEAEGLLLEAHLSHCARCNTEHAALAAVIGGLRAAPPQVLSPSARAAVRRALSPAVRPSRSAPDGGSGATGGRRWPPRLAVAAAVLALVVGGGVLVRAVRPGPFRGTPAGVAMSPRVLAGDVEIIAGGRPVAIARGAAAGSASLPAVLRSRGGGRVHIAEALVELAPGTVFEWRPDDGARLELREGRVTVDVEHRPGRNFRVGTPAFTVEVLGTRFVVDRDGVATLRGVVRVLDRDGAALTRVVAGQTWRRPVDVAASTPAVPEAAGAGAPAGNPSGGSGARESAAPRAGAVASATTPSAVARLASARRLLAAGDAPAARRAVAPLFPLGRERAAEARALFAESFLIEGRYADAIDAYRIVARDFPGTSQAESAAFAIAQLDSENGRAADARRELRAYLVRHPRGRFAREAADRLAELERASP